MESENPVEVISSACGLSVPQVEEGIQALGKILIKASQGLDIVAIPAFGRFVTEKHDETVVVDHASGKRLLLPPEVVLKFIAGATLRKHLQK